MRTPRRDGAMGVKGIRCAILRNTTSAGIRRNLAKNPKRSRSAVTRVTEPGHRGPVEVPEHSLDVGRHLFFPGRGPSLPKVQRVYRSEFVDRRQLARWFGQYDPEVSAGALDHAGRGGQTSLIA